jgi:glycosyltransferase involved in cell wall biosynthesis
MIDIVHCLVIMKNETPRYLESMLAWTSTLIDDLFIVDDQSTDHSFTIANRFAERVVRRPDSVPSFLEDEAAFRHWAWRALGANLELNEQDWVMLLDADEFYIPEMGLEQICRDAEAMDIHAIRFPMPEIWAYDDAGRLYVRKDGFWARNRNIRMVRYLREATFRQGRMGGGSVPQEYLGGRILDTNDVILHFGYLEEEDRREKYQRYSSVANVHNPTHIESILAHPELQLWEGPVPTWWRGLSE